MPPSPPSLPNLAAAFTLARKRWKGNGPGSLPHNVDALVGALVPLLDELKVSSLLDLGCGDATWIIRCIRKDGPVKRYVGVDVVPEVVAKNTALWTAAKGAFPMNDFWFGFHQVSGPDERLPEADLVICRDVLAHLPSGLVSATLAQARRSARWLLATTMPQTRINGDIRIVGGYRPLDLAKKPYDLGPPVRLLPDSDHKQMGLWDWRAGIGGQP